MSLLAGRLLWLNKLRHFLLEGTVLPYDYPLQDSECHQSVTENIGRNRKGRKIPERMERKMAQENRGVFKKCR